MSARVAILGTGKMGSAIARRLAGSGVEPVLWNRTRERAEALGVGSVVATPADAVAPADVVISSLTGADAVRATYSGPSGALAAAHGQTFVEMSTAGPDVLTELLQGIAATGSTLVDAPLLGAPPMVLSGHALVLAGGLDADVERVRPVLELLGEVRHVGPLGSGARLKLVANSMLGVVSLVAAELQSAGEAAGLPPEAVFAVLARFAPALTMRRDGYLHERHDPALFAVRDLVKDLDLALGLFHRSGSPAPVTGLTRELIGEVAAVTPDLDITAIIRRYRSGPIAVAP
jgi:3-hydroxyisobutyrate dehydrogenase-like beta-hydroxyacid dehydrogenase